MHMGARGTHVPQVQVESPVLKKVLWLGFELLQAAF